MPFIWWWLSRTAHRSFIKQSYVKPSKKLWKKDCLASPSVGAMYLTESIDEQPMVGFLPGNVTIRKNYGVSVILPHSKQGQPIVQKDSLSEGMSFIITTARTTETDLLPKTFGRSWPCVHSTNRLYAGFPHLPFYANPDFAVNFYQQALNYKQERKIWYIS